MARPARHVPAPIIATATGSCALLVLAGAWLGRFGEWRGDIGVPTLLLALALVCVVVVTFWWPIHLRPKTKIYMASVPYYLLAALTPPPLAATAAALGALIGETSVHSRRATTRSTITTEAGRRALLVWLGALLTHASPHTSWHVAALVAAAIVMEACDILSCPLVLAPLSTESPLHIVRAVAREAYLLEGAQYLIGLLGALALMNEGWALILLAAPTVLLYLTFRALSQAERAQQVAEDAVRMRDDFLLAGSHDLRTPLTVMLGRIELLRAMLDSGTTPDSATLRRQLHALQRAGARMAETVEEMTDMVHLQLGRTPALHLEQVDLAALLQDTIAMLAHPSSGAPIFLQDGTDGVVAGDRARLARVLQNVIGNAVKYSPAATPVAVDLIGTDTWVTITVADHGIGIPAAELTRIFEPFYRATTAAGIPGSGIGLAGARAVVEQHRGRITVDSIVGSGTTVSIVLPREQRR